MHYRMSSSPAIRLPHESVCLLRAELPFPRVRVLVLRQRLQNQN